MDYQFIIHNTMDPGSARAVVRDGMGLARSGLRFSSTPDGGCLEMSFEADNTVLGLRPLDTVWLRVQIGGTWLPVWLGEVREGGNVRQPGLQTFRLVGLRRLLEETPMLSGAYEQADVAVIVRAALRQQLRYSRLPGQITVSDADVPTVGTDWAISNTNQQTVGAFLEAARVRAGGRHVWGVRADGSFYFKPARTDVYVPPSAAQVEWKPPVADRVFTAVAWVYQIEGEKTPEGQPRTRQAYSQHPGALIWGHRVKRVAVNMPWPAEYKPETVEYYLNGWADGLYELPVRTPARVTVPDLILPGDYRGEVQPSGGPALPIAAYEHTITAQGGLQTHANAEQRSEADLEALIQAIRRTTDDAVQKGGVSL